MRAPGHVELLGDRSLCADGLVVSAAINKFVTIASAPRPDGKIELVSSRAPEREIFWASQVKPNPSAPWADGVKRAICRVQQLGVNVAGFSAAIVDDLPEGADFGAGPALEVATFMTLREMFTFSLTESGLAPPPLRNRKGEFPPLSIKEKLQFAKLGQAAEGLHPAEGPAGLGFLSAYFGKAWHVLNIDLRFGTVEVAPLAGEALVVCDAGLPGDSAETKVIPVLSAFGADEIERACLSAAEHLGAKSLRSVELDGLKAGKSKLTPREYDCATHVVGEISRVVGSERALREDDHRQFGQFMLQSHDSERDLLKNIAPEVEFLVKLARVMPGCLGARRCASASPRATLNLVSYHQAEIFMKLMAQQFDERMGRKLQTYVLQMADGAS